MNEPYGCTFRGWCELAAIIAGTCVMVWAVKYYNILP